MYKTIEEIRTEHQMTKAQYAEFLGISARGLEKRHLKDIPRYWLDEIIKTANLNDGKIVVDTKEGKFKILIKEA